MVSIGGRSLPRRALEFLQAIAGLLLIVMMVHVTLDVALRYLLNAPLPATLEIVSYYYMVAVVFLPIALTELSRESVAVDLFYLAMPGWMKTACTGLVLALSALVYAGLTHVTFGAAVKSVAKSEVVMGPVTVLVWPARLILPFSCGLAALVCVGLFVLMFVSPSARRSLTNHHDTDEVA